LLGVGKGDSRNAPPLPLPAKPNNPTAALATGNYFGLSSKLNFTSTVAAAAAAAPVRKRTTLGSEDEGEDSDDDEIEEIIDHEDPPPRKRVSAAFPLEKSASTGAGGGGGFSGDTPFYGNPPHPAFAKKEQQEAKQSSEKSYTKDMDSVTFLPEEDDTMRVSEGVRGNYCEKRDRRQVTTDKDVGLEGEEGGVRDAFDDDEDSDDNNDDDVVRLRKTPRISSSATVSTAGAGGKVEVVFTPEEVKRRHDATAAYERAKARPFPPPPISPSQNELKGTTDEADPFHPFKQAWKCAPPFVPPQKIKSDDGRIVVGQNVGTLKTVLKRSSSSSSSSSTPFNALPKAASSITTSIAVDMLLDTPSASQDASSLTPSLTVPLAVSSAQEPMKPLAPQVIVPRKFINIPPPPPPLKTAMNEFYGPGSSCGASTDSLSSSSLPSTALTYDLQATVNHLGTSMLRGHYVAHTRGCISLDAEGVNDDEEEEPNNRPWYKHDDSVISVVDPQDVLGWKAQASVYLLSYVLRE